MPFKDEVASIVQEILSDSTQWPPEMSYAIPQMVAQSPVTPAPLPGDLIDLQQHTSPVSTSAITFAAGADLISTDLEFIAQGGNNYLLTVAAPYIQQTSTTAHSQISINLDGADAGIFVNYFPEVANATQALYAAGPFTPSAGSRTVNARAWNSSAGTTNVGAGTGGAGTTLPLIVALYRI